MRVNDLENARGDLCLHGRFSGTGKSETLAIITLVWDHEVFGGVPFAVLVEPVVHGESGRVPDTVCI